MAKSKITHAKRFLLNLLAARRLNAWCEEHNLPHTTIYNLAAEDIPPTYSVICKLLPYIEPAKWFYSEDEEIPYKTRLLPEWNPDDIPFFVRKHRHDYKELLDKYDISPSTGVNLFINYRTKPSVALIAKACADVNPEEFFTLGDAKEDGKFYPERGDVVAISGKTMLVLTKEKSNRETHSFTGVCVQDEEVDLNTLETITYSRINPEFIKKASGELVSDTLKKIRLLFK